MACFKMVTHLFALLFWVRLKNAGITFRHFLCISECVTMHWLAQTGFWSSACCGRCLARGLWFQVDPVPLDSTWVEFKLGTLGLLTGARDEFPFPCPGKRNLHYSMDMPSVLSLVALKWVCVEPPMAVTITCVTAEFFCRQGWKNTNGTINALDLI